jgi:hypothetical protein
MYDYHDSMFTTLSIEWESGTTVLLFELSSEPQKQMRVVVSGTSLLEFKREFPWGKSVSVNHLKVSTSGPEGQRLEVEMQSGDQIIVVGREVLEKLAD